LSIDLSTPTVFQDPTGRQDAPAIKETAFTSMNYPILLENEDFETGGGFQISTLDTFNLDDFEISTEMLDAFSSLEPIDATVGALRDFN
jgi:hypothetical protein